MMYISTTFKYVFDYQEDDIYWCTADVGWITGHSYVSYGPLVNGATGLIVSSFEVKKIFINNLSVFNSTIVRTL